MEFIIYLILILSIIALFISTNYYYAPIIYATVIVFSLFGLLMAISSPIEVETGELTEIYNYNSSCINTSSNSNCLESIDKEIKYEKVPLINEAMILLFISFLITSIFRWANDREEE